MSYPLSLNCRGTLLTLDQPRIMGILNVTPDSFYDGGKFDKDQAWLSHVERMLDEGADLIDVGGMSSRPGADLISEEEELKRVIPVVKGILKNFPQALVSVDTIRSAVARQAADEGAVMVNDISAGKFDPEMFSTVAELKLPYVLMHMQGEPSTMQKDPKYRKVTLDVLDFLIQKVGQLRELGVADIVIDPGFGFGKTVAHNYRLLRDLASFEMLDCPILVGASRKSMICRVLGVSPEHALNGTTAVHALALLNGANLLRVHDVRQAVEVIQIMDAYAQGSSDTRPEA